MGPGLLPHEDVCTFISAASPTAFGRKAGPHDAYATSCFLYVHLDPQTSKFTFRNKQAIYGNDMRDIQLGRQKVNDGIKDLHGPEADSAEQAHRPCGLLRGTRGGGGEPAEAPRRQEDTP